MKKFSVVGTSPYKFKSSTPPRGSSPSKVTVFFTLTSPFLFIIPDVTIINRGEHGDRLKNIQVHIGNEESNHRLNPVCHDRVRYASDGEAVRLQCNPPIPGRYVAVQMYGKGILTMCEVIVASRIGNHPALHFLLLLLLSYLIKMFLHTGLL